MTLSSPSRISEIVPYTGAAPSPAGGSYPPSAAPVHQSGGTYQLPSGARSEVNSFSELSQQREGSSNAAYGKLSLFLEGALKGFRQLRPELEQIVQWLGTPADHTEARDRLRIVMSTPLAGIWKLPKGAGLSDRFPRLDEFIQKADALAREKIGEHTRQTTNTDTGEQKSEPIYFKDLGDELSSSSMTAFSAEDIAQVSRLLQDVVLLSEDIEEYFSQFGLPRRDDADAADNPKKKTSELGEPEATQAIAPAAEYGSSLQYRGEVSRQVRKFFTVDHWRAKFSGRNANASAVDTVPVISSGDAPVLTLEGGGLPNAIATSEPVGSFLFGPGGCKDFLYTGQGEQGSASGQ